jgi:beta-glucanase (GH16 family)
VNRRVLAALGGVVAIAIVTASVLVVVDRARVDQRADGCAPLAASTPPVTPALDEDLARATDSATDSATDDLLVFADHLWEVRTGDGDPTTVGGWGRDQVEVRDDGALVLRQQRAGGTWSSAEVQSVHRGFGYGTYEWTVESALDQLDPVVVLGLFTFERDAPGGREIDVEVAQWGDPDGDNMNFVSWFPDRLARTWTVDDRGPTTHLFTWGPDRIVWCSQDASGEVLAWTARQTAMEPGDERVHMNLWISRDTPPEQETEIVITDFRFRPLEPDQPRADRG